jgi:hypothetical protein
MRMSDNPGFYHYESEISLIDITIWFMIALNFLLIL